MYHEPVMVEESISGLEIKDDGIYVDATFGGGGHSAAILNRLKSGKLIVFDQDENALKNILTKKGNLLPIHANFRYIKNYLKQSGIEEVDGIHADLGVSSHQLDVAERGFSTRYDAFLDMRMNRQNPLTASQIVNQYSTEKLQKIFSEYGEVTNAGMVARSIAKHRKYQHINTTGDLLKAIQECIPSHNSSKYLAKIFQALRIETNGEIEALRELLRQCSGLIKKGGILEVISYHSLEDRIVKNFMRSGNFEGVQEKNIYGYVQRPFEPVTKKPILPGLKEKTRNPRARSAKLRIAKKN